MDQKKAALLTACCGAVILLGVLMPWYSVSFDGFPGAGAGEAPLGAASVSSSWNGTHDPFLGTWTLILGVVGGIAAGLLWMGRTQGLPLNARQLALLSLGTMGVAALLTLIDVTSHGKGGSFGPVSGGKSVGIYLTFLATIAGTYCAWVLNQKTGSGTTPTSPGS